MNKDLDSLNREKIIKNINKNYLVEASAGSGKTTSLVNRMVSMIESGIDVSKIVTLTFTKKAANEFYERFYSLLNKRSKLDYDSSKDTHLEKPNDKTRLLDLEALKHIDLCFMNTIDAYFNQIILEHPLEANIPSSSNIIENNDELKIEILLFLDDVRNNKYGLDTQKELIEVEKLNKRDDLVNVIIFSLDQRAYSLIHDSLDSEIYKGKLKTLNDEFEKIKNVLSYISNIDQSYISPKKHLEAYKYIKNNLNKIKATKANNIKQIKFICSGIKEFVINGKSNFDYSNIIKHNLTTHLIQNEKNKNIKLDINILSDTVNYLIYTKTLNFISLIKPYLIKFLTNKGKLRFIDNSVYLKELLKDKIKGPNVLKNIQNKHTYYLIDEFQDTSPLQAEIFLRLTSDYAETIDKLKPKDGTLFLVGDPKQSIYHFRGADINSYLFIKDLIHKNNIGEVVTLSKNFRSTNQMCDCFDKIFNSNFFLDLNIQYSSISSNKDKYDEFTGTYLYESTKDNDPETIAKLILTLINDQSKFIQEKNNKRRIKYSDFMIITSKKESIAKYKRVLSNYNIPCFSEGSVIFTDSELIQNIISIFDYISNKSQYNFYKILKSPLFKNFKFCIDGSTNSLEFLLNIIPSLDNLLKIEKPSSLLDALIKDPFILNHSSLEGLDYSIALYNLLKSEEENGNVTNLIDASIYLNSVLESKEIERIAPLNRINNVVKIANLHKVKGLESNIIILAFSSKPSENVNLYIDEKSKTINLFKFKNEDNIPVLNLSNNIASNKEELEKNYLNGERMRLLYVAATRASKALFINTPIYVKRNLGSNWEPLIKNIKCNTLELNDININKNSYTNTSSFEIKNDNKLESLIKNNNKSYDSLLPSDAKTEIIKNDDEIYIKNDAALKGTLVHKLMEYIVKNKNIKLNEKICDFIANEYEANQYIPLLKKVLKKIYNKGYEQISGIDNDIYNLVKNYDCYTEVPFSYKNNENIIYGIVDLILVKDNEVIIVDYKTDSNKNNDHSKQLEFYRQALKSINGTDSKAYIYNIDLND